jgi:hypothetical protein
LIRKHVNSMTPEVGFTTLALAIALLVGCAKPPKPVEDLSGRENLSAYTLSQVRGTRDGDRLDAKAKFSDGSSTLTIELHLAIGSPTTLKMGSWRWRRDGQTLGGALAERSVMFLGGQNGPPSVGGSFDLLGPEGVAEYRVAIPTTQLEARLPIAR